MIRAPFIFHRAQCFSQVQRFASAVRSLADHAQADIGLDYAWLEDVTVKDWQRYHDLARSKSWNSCVAVSR